jgi:hypothetical protein
MRSSSSSGASTGRPLSVSATPSRSNMLAARRALGRPSWAPTTTRPSHRCADKRGNVKKKAC